MNLIRVLSFILFISRSIFAQDIKTTEIKIFEEFTPSIVDATKINDRATYSDSSSNKIVQEYNFFDFNLRSNYKTKILAPAKIKEPLLDKLYNNSISFGFGNYWKTQADIIYCSTRSKNKSYGIYFNHHADKYLPAKNSKNSFYGFYKQITLSNVYRINLIYDKRTAFYENENDLFSGYFRNRFAFTKLSLNIFSNKNNPNQIDHNTKLSISDLNEFSENHVHVSSNIANLFENLPLKINTRFDSYFNYNSELSPFRSKYINYFNFSPNYALNKYNITLGFDLSVKSSKQNFHLMPNVRFSKELVKDIIKIETGFSQSHYKNSIKYISEINPYIHTYGMNQSINANYAFDQNLSFTKRDKFYFSLRNILSDNELIKTSISYSIVDNFLHFVRVDNLSYSRYKSEYIDLNEFNLKLEYRKKINSFLSLDLKCDFYNWSEDVFNTSNLEFNLQVPFKLEKKINLTPSVLFFTKKRFATISSSQIAVPYENPNIQKLGPYLYANLLFEYNYSKWLSTFLNIQNLTNNKNETWLGYREQGISMLFGIKSSF